MDTDSVAHQAVTTAALAQAAASALARVASCSNRDPAVEAALHAADQDGVAWLVRVRLRNAYVWQRHLGGDTAVALALMEETVATLRGRGDAAEGLALAGLAAAYSNLERAPEAIVASLRSARVFEACGEKMEAVRARVILVAAMVSCEAWPLVDSYAVPILIDLPSLEPRIQRWTRKHLQNFAMDQAVMGGLGLASLIAVESLETFLGDDAKTDEFNAVLPMNRAEILLRVGRMTDAEAMVDRALALGPAVPQVMAQLRLIRAKCLTSRGALAEGRIEALAAIDAVSGAHEDHSNARVRNLATSVGSLLLNEIGDPDAAEVVFDLAASAVVARLREIEHAFASIPELRDATADDLALVAACREHACRSTARNLDTIRRAFERAARSGGNDLLARLASNSEGRVLCAWCGAVRTGDDRWLPIAEHLPPDGSMSHGICSPCSVRVHTEILRESDGTRPLTRA